jgi:hypothetical protein
MAYGTSQAQSTAAIAYLVSQGISPAVAEQRVANMSRQRVWQLVRRAEGRCRNCGGEASGTYCGNCRVKTNARERDRRKMEASL